MALVLATTAGACAQTESEPSELQWRLGQIMVASAGSRWHVDARVLSRSELIQAAGMLKESARAEVVLGPLREACTLHWSRPAESIVLHVHHFSDAGAARRYHDFAAELQRKQDETWNGPESAVQVSASRFRTIAAPMNGAQALRIDKRVQVAPHAAPSVLTAFLIQRECLCLEITWFGLPAEETWMWRVVRCVAATSEGSSANCR